MLGVLEEREIKEEGILVRKFTGKEILMPLAKRGGKPQPLLPVTACEALVTPADTVTLCGALGAQTFTDLAPQKSSLESG